VVPGKAFLDPEWNLEEDFLKSYELLPAKIPSWECFTDEQKEKKDAKKKKRPGYYKYIEM
jgi:hypothetical protein